MMINTKLSADGQYIIRFMVKILRDYFSCPLIGG